MSAVRSANLGLRFALELAALVAFAVWGASLSDAVLVRAAAGVAAPALAALAWGLVVAPRARLDAGPAVRVAVELAVLGGGALALLAAGHEAAGVVLGALVVGHLVLYHLTEPTATSRPREA